MAERFWRLASPDSTSRYAEWAHDEMELEQIICPADPDHQRGGKRLTDLSVVLPGASILDFSWTWYSECLIQEHVLGLFKQEGFSGYEAKLVKARYRRNSVLTPPTLWELVVTGWGGVAPPGSGVRLTKSCPACGSLGYSCFDHPERLIDQSQWDGSDFFMVWPLPGFIFVTDRVAHIIIRERKLQGVRLVRAGDLRCVGGLSPGRLSHWMPEARAREIGEPLGIH